MACGKQGCSPGPPVRSPRLLATRVLSGLLFQVRATAPFTYTLIAALHTLTAATAALLAGAPRRHDGADDDTAGGLRIGGRQSTSAVDDTYDHRHRVLQRFALRRAAAVAQSRIRIGGRALAGPGHWRCDGSVLAGQRDRAAHIAGP